MGIEFHDEYWPYVVDIYRGKVTSEELAEHRDFMRGMVARGERYGILYDLSRSETTSMEERRKDADLIKELKDEAERLCIGCAFVTPGTVLRIALNFIFFLAPPPSVYKIVSNIEDGHQWMSEQFRIAGIAYPPAVEDYVRSLGEEEVA